MIGGVCNTDQFGAISQIQRVGKALRDQLTRVSGCKGGFRTGSRRVLRGNMGIKRMCCQNFSLENRRSRFMTDQF